MDSKFAQKDESLDHDCGDTISDKFIKIYRVSHMYSDDGCGIQMSQATATSFYMLFKHTYGKLFWNLVAMASIFPLSMALRCHSIVVHKY